MTEPQFEEAQHVPVEPEAEITATQPVVDAPRRRGRPRAQTTLARDERVVQALSEGPKTRDQLAEELGESTNLVYLALWRLSHQDPPRIEKTSDVVGGRHSWRLVG